MLLFTNPTDVERIVEGGVKITSVNIGGMAFRQGKTQVNNAISVDAKDIEAFNKLNARGIELEEMCIRDRRNAIASVKAINAARMAMRRTSEPRVSLDKVIETMYETGKDMNAKYRETSRGGLAIKVQCD